MAYINHQNHVKDITKEVKSTMRMRFNKKMNNGAKCTYPLKNQNNVALHIIQCHREKVFPHPLSRLNYSYKARIFSYSIHTERNIMPNNEEWKKRTDAWIRQQEKWNRLKRKKKSKQDQDKSK